MRGGSLRSRPRKGSSAGPATMPTRSPSPTPPWRSRRPPTICYPALADASSLKREVVDGLDIVIVRELTGGVYFGEPKTITDLGNGQKRAVDTQVYDTYE